MPKGMATLKKKPLIIGAGLVVLDIILNNGDTAPIFKAGGTCGNVLAGLSYLEWRGAAFSRVGADSAAKLMLKDLMAYGVDVSYVGREEKLKTPRIIERLASNITHPKHTFLLRCPTCHEYLPRFQSPTLDAVEPIISGSAIPAVFFFDRVSPAILKLARAYKDRGALIFFEPNNLRNMKDIKRAITFCHVLKYSGYETKKGSPGEDDHLLKKLNSPLIIKTLGKDGLMFSCSKSEAWHYQKGITVGKLKDTCGAGDWCTIGFLYFMNEFAASRNIPLTDAIKSFQLINRALQHAQMLSALSCGFIGARGLSDAVVHNDLIQTIEHCVSDKTDINAVIGGLTSGKHRTFGTNKTTTDMAACPVCLLV